MVTEVQKAIWQKRAQLRSSLCKWYPCFTHETEAARLACIRKAGLKTGNPGTSSEDAIIKELGVNQREMICLHPVGSEPDVRSSGNGPFVLLAVSAASLPEVTLDWSFVPSWSLVPELEKCGIYGNEENIFLEVVRRRGSVAALCGIAPEHLYVLCTGANALQRWCPLINATNQEIVEYTKPGHPPSVPECPSNGSFSSAE